MNKPYQLVIRQAQNTTRLSYKTASGALKAKDRILKQGQPPVHITFYAPGEPPQVFTEQDMPLVPPDKDTDFYASDAWRKLRYQALEHLGNRCVCCGATPEHGVRLHVDHIKPRSRYPQLALALSNLQILCEDCNLGKGNRSERQW